MSLGDTDPDHITNKYNKEAYDYPDQWSLIGVKQDIELIVEHNVNPTVFFHLRRH
ncbi:hypothetical protein [Glaciecola punicea]|jgi:hypothetical protein|uniref:hypothetical protein n=1 Tax=Glaciecola punicea TaxID=56804 RepID=UPI001495966C|nr:hypothetical protein [Glaciecola punicea]